MLRLVELHVRKYRDLIDGGPLRFGPGPVFLLGPNGSGKTTLLELIGVLLGDDLGPLFREEDAVELSWVLEAEGEGETPATRLELSLSVDAVVRSTTTDARTAKRARRGWKISGVLPARGADERSIDFWQDSTGAQLFTLASGKSLVVDRVELGVNEPGWLFELALAISDAETVRGNDVRGSDRIELVEEQLDPGSPSRLDEALMQFVQIVGNDEDSIEIVAPDEHSEQGSASHDLPAWVPWPTETNRIQTTDHPDLQLLTRLLGAERVELRPRLLSDDGRGRRRWRGFDIYVHWGGGALHHHSELSFGQKRLIALIWRIGVGVNLPLLTDELTNGLHAGWVRAIIDHLGPRQGFHALQNPLLLDRYGPGEGPEEIAGRFVICSVEPGERGRQWRWRSPTSEECERLWAAYTAGYQQLSELLISEGLW
jgi:energy-coupling factor transporter ATP-binding protein EcfA2